MSEMKVPMIISRELNKKEGQPFSNCCLSREKYAKLLTHIISNYQKGFVLALNNPWGTGKTTFLNMWQRYLENEKYQVLHFNAWKSDYSSDPFIALISQLKQLGDKNTQKAYKGFISKAATLVTRIGPGLVKGFVKRYVEDEGIEEIVGVTSEITAESLEKQINDQLKTENTIGEFTKSLKQLVSESGDKNPLIFIIDELDRCRPSYAVAVLEYIKHFFSVEGIVFVLAIDKEQLGHAVRGVYGSDLIDADEYLRRFIDLEYSIPDPELSEFCDLLYSELDFNRFFENKKRNQIQNLKDEGLHFKRFSNNLLSQTNVSLRTIEKIYFQSRVILSTLRINKRVYSGLYFFLIYLKNIHNEFYIKIRNVEYSLDDLARVYEEIVDCKFIDSDKYMMLNTEACLITFYTNYFNLVVVSDTQLDCLSEDDKWVTFETTHSERERENLVSQLVSLYRGLDGDYSILNFFEMIDMSENFELND